MNKEAEQNVQKALHAKADLPEALQLKQKIEIARNLQSLATKVEQEPANQEARTDLQKNIAAAAQLKWANPDAVTTLARAQSAIGDHAAALKTIDKAVAIDPKSDPAQKLRQTILLKPLRTRNQTWKIENGKAKRARRIVPLHIANGQYPADFSRC